MRAMLFAAWLAGMLSGCIVVNTPPVPEYSVEIAPAAPPSADGEPPEPVRYKPYARELNAVLRQEATIEKELGKRDWNELGDELGDWQRQVRRLAGAADTSHDPTRMRRCCDALDAHIASMRKSQRYLDARGVERALEEAGPVLRELSRTFPLTEPVPDPKPPPDAASAPSSSSRTGDSRP